MIAEFGHFALVLALAIAVVQSVVPFVGAQRGDLRLQAVAGPTAVTLLVLVGMSFAALTYAYVTSDFSLKNVFENSHADQPLIYRYTSVWGNHEGSMLLWTLILVLFGALVAVFGRNLPARLKALVLAVQGWISFAFLAFILGTSNPFTRLDPAPFEGQDLNPILQDLGLAIHPPLLYLGYVGCSISFSFAVAALIEGRIDAAWARWARPWTLASWSFLTLGIAMGSYWAYYELGWGGFWFWDPVENASLMPWLAATALLHSAIVMERRESLKIWSILLAILAFSLSLLGTFLVRSGVLTSVHAFASDPTRGVFILAILVLFIGGSLGLFAFRAGTLKPGGIFAPISREGSLILNNVFLTAATATVLVGTLYPLLLDSLTGAKISVGAPYYNLTFVPLVAPLLVIIPFGPMLAWKRGDLYAATQRLMWAFGLSLAGAIVVLAFTGVEHALATLGIWAGLWLVLGAIAELAYRSKVGQVPLADSWRRFAGLPRSAYGTALAHAGVGIVVLGIVSASVWSTEEIRSMQAGDTTSVAGFDLALDGFRAADGPNYTGTEAHLTVTRDGRQVAILTPAKRVYTARNSPTSEASIVTRGFSQLYASLGDPDSSGGVTVRVFWRPYVTLMWLGAVVMAIGGALSLSDRRLRVGAPRPAHARRLVPAE